MTDRLVLRGGRGGGIGLCLDLKGRSLRLLTRRRGGTAALFAVEEVGRIAAFISGNLLYTQYLLFLFSQVAL